MGGMLVVLLSVPMSCETPPRTPYEQYLLDKDRHDAAVARWESLGGNVNMADPGVAASLREASERQVQEALELLEEMMLLDSLRLTRVELSRRNLRPMANLHMRHLTVSRTPLDDETLAALFAVDGLRSVHLIDTGAGDAAVEHLRKYEDLENLTLAYEPLTDAGLAELANLHRLRVLRLIEAEVSEEAMRELVEVNTRLVIELGDDGDEIIRGVDATR